MNPIVKGGPLFSSCIPHAVSNSIKINWYWKSNQNPLTALAQSNLESSKKEEEWNQYLDIENEIIEEAFQDGNMNVELDLYIINLHRLVQINKVDFTKERSIKRCATDRRYEVKCLRVDRFLHPPRLSRPFHDKSNDSPFYYSYVNQYDMDDDILFELAAKGIITEGEKLERKCEAEWIARQLRAAIGEEVNETRIMIGLYTRESFLYKIINKAMRDDDMTKLDTLGPLCFLLRRYSLWTCVDEWPIYRGCYLENEQIEEYKKAVGTRKIWYSFTSMTKNRNLAEIYGNTLFFINSRANQSLFFDISEISHFPEEEEVFADAGLEFEIEKVDFVENITKYHIYLMVHR